MIWETLPNLVEEIRNYRSASDFDEASFPAWAGETLSRYAFHQDFDLGSLCKAFMFQDSIGTQLDIANNFGDPPLTLHHGGDFVVDLYLWRHSQINIHDHKFAGAFMVLSGWSLQNVYSYQASAVEDDVSVGQLRLESCRILNEGDIGVIEPGGQGLIHQVHHLSGHNVSLVIRTVTSHASAFQWNYWGGGFAMAQKPVPDRELKLEPMLRYLHDRDHAAFQDIAAHHARTADHHAFFQNWYRYLNATNDFKTLVKVCMNARGENRFAVSEFLDGVTWEARYRAVDWVHCDDEASRAFVYLFLTFSDLSLTPIDPSELFEPGDVVENFMAWLDTLESQVRYMPHLDVSFPDMLAPRFAHFDPRELKSVIFKTQTVQTFLTKFILSQNQ